MGDYHATPPSPPIREKVGSGKVLLALSGGVDSSVAAALLAEAVGDQLTCVFVDHGLHAQERGRRGRGRLPEVGHQLRPASTPRPASFGKLAGVTEPERKRKIIGEEFIRVFEDEAKKIGRGGLSWPRAPSTPTSSSPAPATLPSSRATTTWAACPTMWTSRRSSSRCACCSRTRCAQLGRELGLPEYLVMRQPFPGPGLAIRVIGEITQARSWTSCGRPTPSSARRSQRPALDYSISQYFAVLTNMRSVGVMGDGRTYDYTLALRGVTTTDFMTADWARIPYDVLDKISARIVNEVPGISTASSTISPASPRRPLSGNNPKNAENPHKYWVFED